MSTPGFVDFLGRQARVSVEIVDTPEEQRRGLANRTELAPDAGMLFWLGTRQDHGFWMRGCKISLDLIFIDYDRVVGVLTLHPGDLHVHSVGRPSYAVLEVNGGFCAKHGIVTGDRVQISLD
jgi:uncharacterized protein